MGFLQPVNAVHILNPNFNFRTGRSTVFSVPFFIQDLSFFGFILTLQLFSYSSVPRYATFSTKPMLQYLYGYLGYYYRSPFTRCHGARTHDTGEKKPHTQKHGGLITLLLPYACSIILILGLLRCTPARLGTYCAHVYRNLHVVDSRLSIFYLS